MVVLHYTAMGSAAKALEWLATPEAQVSAHYLIDETGTAWSLVDETHRAWHAGAGAWGGVTDVNSHSIGIELANPGDRPFPEPQMARLEALLAEILTRHAIRPERVIAHSDMAPERKIDPGPRFDWRRLAVQGLSIWPSTPLPPAPADAAGFWRALDRLGYPVGTAAEARLAAFRLRFRPRATGPVSAQDTAIAQDLARRFPVDPAANPA